MICLNWFTNLIGSTDKKSLSHVTYIDLKQTVRCFSSKDGFIWISENCSSGPATMVRHMQVPTQQGRKNAFIEEKRKLGGRAIVNNP